MMADSSVHIRAANRNQMTIDHLCGNLESHSAWIATVAFYKALHLVEAAFASDQDVRHTTDHGSRNQVLKTTQKYKNIWKHYRPLSSAAQIARYLCGNGRDYKSFDDYLSANEVCNEILFHRLKQVENSVKQLLGESDAIVSIDTTKKVVESS